MSARPELTPGSLEFWAGTRPERIALVDGDRQLSYAQWNAAADRVAEGLAQRGIVAGDIVVARMQVCLEWPILASALGKLGCSLLGLNWRLTPDESRYVLANSGARALVCDDADPLPLVDALRGLDLKLCVSLTGGAHTVGFDDLLAAPEVPRQAAGDPPLIIYTSGTTGLPKGVVMGRSAHTAPDQLMAYLRDLGQPRPDASPDDVVLVTMPVHHAAGPSQLWGAQRNGRKAVLMRRFDAEGVLALIQRHRVSDWNAVPTMLKRIAALPPEVLARYDVSSIRHLSVGAAPVPWVLKEWVFGYFGENVLSEGYGSTETGMVTRLRPDMQRAKPGSSGLPFAGVSIEVRDAQGRVLAPGEIGELWVRTPVTLKSYLNADALGPDTLDERGYFRIGDIGYLDADGYLYLTDRAKDLIISGGVNIYPAEIEAVLLRHPAVFDAAVIGVPDEEFGEQVKAVCELKPGHTASPQELMAFAAGQLASYKRPRSIDLIDELPRLSMGKVLKRALREPYWTQQERQI